MWCQIAEMHMKGMNSVSPAIYIFPHIEVSLEAQRVKHLPAMQKTWVQILGLPWRRKWQPTPVFLPGESHGQRSPVGYSPWDCKESDTIERFNFLFTHRKALNSVV